LLPKTEARGYRCMAADFACTLSEKTAGYV
jgi:hypothetical protein